MHAADRLTLVQVGLLVFASALIGRAAKVQLIDGKEWAARAERQHFSAAAFPAARGPILDATGTPLVESRELTRLSVAPGEVRDIGALTRALSRAGVAPAALARLRERGRRWVEIPGAFPPADIAHVVAMRGVHAIPLVDRVYARTGGVRPLLGRLDRDGRPLDGLELALDSILRGDSVRVTLPRDRQGRILASASRAPRAHPGVTVTLTIHRALQDICDRALAFAVDTLRASGGDIIVLNPHDGQVLAMVSRRAAGSPGVNTAVSEPFEPGSTLKPFFAAGLIAHARARMDEMIPTHDGLLEVEGRTIHDVHKASALSLADVIRYSSNVGIVQFSSRLAPRESYELLRDLGFGTTTGLGLPAEAGGTLREPREWSRQTAASLPMGYEISVTPLQLASAYATLANGGVLLEPQLVKEIRAADGEVLYSSRPRVVRRVFPAPAANAARAMLLGVVETGTGIKADLATYRVGGKSGTARRVEAGRGYTPNRYTATFVGLFPGDSPQYVVLVKLDDPRAAIYGGETAAPVTRVVLEAALAARDAALDRGALADASAEALDSFLTERRLRDSVQRAGAVEAASNVMPRAITVAVAPALPLEREPPPAARVRFDLPFVAPSAPRETALKSVPDVNGLTARAAVQALHRVGFRVRLSQGARLTTIPAAGALLESGSVVVLTVTP